MKIIWVNYLKWKSNVKMWSNNVQKLCVLWQSLKQTVNCNTIFVQFLELRYLLIRFASLWLVDEAKKQHKNLKFINDHQNCLLLSYKAMLENAKKDLILSQAMATSSKSIILDDTTKEKIVWMERQLAGVRRIILFLCITHKAI